MKAGTLEVEIIANVAKLQANMRAVERAVGDMSSDVVRKARAANDNLSGIGRNAGAGIQKFSREVAQLKAQLDPAWAATQKYKQEIQIAQQALAQGAITHRQYVEAVRQSATAAGLLRDKQAEAAVASRQAADAAAQLALRQREAAAQQATYAAQASALRAQLDPMFGAQQRFNVALDQADNLLRAGAITTREHTAAIEMARKALQSHATAVAGSGAAMGGTVQPMRQLTASAGAQRAGMQQLSFQIGDVTQQFALGTSPMIIFAQQGGQVVQALSMMQGGAKGLIGFLAGPWGAVMLGAAMIVGTLISKMGDGEKASLSLGDAIDFQKMSTNELIAAINELEKAQSKEIQTSYASEVQKYRNARAALAEAAADRQSAIAKLQVAKAEMARTQGDGQGGTGARGGLGALVGVYDAEIKSLNEAIVKGDLLIRESHIPLARREAAAATNAATAATLRYEKAETLLQERRTKGLISGMAFQEQLAKLMSTRDAEIKAARDADKKPNRSEERRLERLAREAESVTVTTDALYALADAYGVSDGAALIAEARANAVGQAIKKQGDIAGFVSRELAKLIAQRVVDAAQMESDMGVQTAALRKANQAVADGIMPVSVAADLMRDELALRPFLAAASIAEGEAKQKLTDRINGLRKAQADMRAENARAQFVNEMAAANDDLDKMKLELDLISATNRERAVALAQLDAEQKIKSMPGLSPDEQKAFVQVAVDRAAATDDLKTAQDNYNESLNYTLDLLSAMDEQAQAVANVLGDAFGGAGAAIGDLTTAISQYAAREQDIADWKRAEIKAAGKDAARLAQIEALASRRSSAAQIDGIGGVLGAAKSLFKEHSAGYEAMEAAQKAFAIVQLINTAKSVAAGAAKMFEFLGPFAFPAIAAMLGVMASLGFGGGSSGSLPTAQDLQDAQGTGSVLGDAEAKSESISRALDIMASNSNKDLEYSNAMVKSLRAIETNIGTLSSLLARQLGLTGGAFDQSGLGLGSTTKLGFVLPLIGNLLKDIPIIGGLLKSLFGTKTTKTLLDQGLTFDPATIESILNGGISGQTYQDIQTKKKKKFLGISVGGSTRVNTVTGELDSELENQVALLIGSMRDSIVSAASILGIEGAGAVLDAFKVDLGKISLKDLTGTEIQEQLTAVFSKLGDDMARAAIPGIETFQKVGEGLFETLARLAKDYMTIDTALKSIGMTFGSVGASSVEAREALIDLFGSLDEFVEQTNFFRDNFLTEAEQMAPIISAVQDELARLGQANVTTKEQFKAAVLGIDLTSAAGQELYASLLAVAPAFAKVMDYTDTLSQKLIDDFKKTVDAFTGYGDTLRKYRDSLFAAETGTVGGYIQARREFMSGAALAAQGDAAALGNLSTLGKTFLDASMNNASSLLDYQRDVAAVARGVDKGIFAADAVADYAQLQIDAIDNTATILTSIDGGIANMEAILASIVAPTPTSTTASVSALTGASGTDSVAVAASTSALRDEIIGLRADQKELGTRLADTQNRLLLLHQRWDGDGLLVRNDEDTPIYTEAAA